ncbi:ABC transporter permease [Actinotalea sp. C106]|uniref:ABC transporter permease n=1 Tax=Actinotalea sp. C106 TaxID=2908644 RepID=UPI002028DA94|nr:ABC transporter permease [Actinotalea sp. C106]
MSTPITAWKHLTVAEAKNVWRERSGILLSLGLPIGVLVLGGLNSDAAEFDTYVMPFALAFIAAFVTIGNVPDYLAEHRHSGVLRRLALTPAHPALLMGAQAVVNLAILAAGIGIALGIAVPVFGVSAPVRPGMALLSLAAGTLAMLAIGMLIAAVAPTTNAARGLGLLALLLMAGLNGLFVSRGALPSWMVVVGEHLPLGATASLMSDAWSGAATSTSHLAALAACGIIAAALAVRYFRWG